MLAAASAGFRARCAPSVRTKPAAAGKDPRAVSRQGADEAARRTRWYLLRSRKTYPFNEVNDLYHYFLIDAQLDGVTRTSRVAAAIASVQLYIQRCIMNLEETPAGDPIRWSSTECDSQCGAEVAGELSRLGGDRKVFLYPENYLEPALRDDKTPSSGRSKTAVVEADHRKRPCARPMPVTYAALMRSHRSPSPALITNGDVANRRDVLHLLGATSDDPPIFYYRRVEDFHFGIESQDRATRWGAWQRVDLQIPTRVVSPVVFQGQLYVFWVRYITKSLNEFVDGKNRFTGYSHRAHVEFSKRRLDGSWISPQRISLTQLPFTTRGDGVVLDPLVGRSKQTIALPLFGEISLYSNYQPLYDTVSHEQPIEDYTPRGLNWDRVYPSSGTDAISLRGINFQMWSKLDLFRRRIGARINYDIDSADPNRLPHYVPWLPHWSVQAVLDAIQDLILGLQPDELMREILKFVVGQPRNLLWSQRAKSARDVHAITLGDNQYLTFDSYSFASLLLEREWIDYYKKPLSPAGNGPPEWHNSQWHSKVTEYFESLCKGNRIICVPASARLEVVNGAYSDAIIQNGRDIFHIGFRSVDNKPYVLRRLGTSVAESVARKLFEVGLDALLATQNQLLTNEPAHGFTLTANHIADRTCTDTLDFDGPMGTYFREIFFHIPFLLADHLNSLGEHEAAQRRFHVFFDPTSSEVITDLPADLAPAERRRREHDRVWRYRDTATLMSRHCASSC